MIRNMRGTTPAKVAGPTGCNQVGCTIRTNADAASGTAHAGSNPAGGARSTMQPDMLIAALPTDLHLYSDAADLVQHAPLVPMSWPPMHLIARPRSKLRPEGPFLRPTSQPDRGVKHSF